MTSWSMQVWQLLYSFFEDSSRIKILIVSKTNVAWQSKYTLKSYYHLETQSKDVSTKDYAAFPISCYYIGMK